MFLTIKKHQPIICIKRTGNLLAYMIRLFSCFVKKYGDLSAARCCVLLWAAG